MKKGFTLLEILLVIAAIGILAAIVILAINPQRQLSQVRNAQRQSDISTLNKALNQYLIDTGEYPVSVEEYYLEVCNTGSEQVGGPTDCTGFADLRPLVPQYVASIPPEPNASDQAGYMVRERGGSAQLVATNPELSQEIEINHRIAGTLSTPFGSSGSELIHLGGDEFTYASTIHNDYLYVGGYTSASGAGDAFVMRYDLEGDIDITFGGGDGIVIIANGQPGELIIDIELFDEDSIYLLSRYGSGSSTRSQVIRLLADGSIDTSFGTSGFATYSANFFAQDFTITNEEVFVVGYEVDGGGYTDALILNYDLSGNLETSFGSGGVVRYDNLTKSTGHYIYGNSIVVDEDGDLYITGESYDENSSQWEQMFIRKYLSDTGALDTSFAEGDGMFESAGIDEGGYSIQIANNSLYVGGYDWYNDDWVSAVWKLSLDGVLDASYGGGDGIAVDTVSDESYLASIGNSMAVDSDGSVYVAGMIYSPSYEGMITKFDSSGVLDTNFFDDGIWHSSIESSIFSPTLYGGYYLYAVGGIEGGGSLGGDDGVVFRFE
jgi:uncharacterized delta-60 repeat protein/prepilin-type N-terminal cleavage/methylation domain-containing protein